MGQHVGHAGRAQSDLLRQAKLIELFQKRVSQLLVPLLLSYMEQRDVSKAYVIPCVSYSLSKNCSSSALSIPTATAIWSGVLMVNVTRVEAARVARINSAGPTSHPTLHPVAENCLPALPTVTVRSQKSCSDAIRTCFEGVSARTSYCRRKERQIELRVSVSRLKTYHFVGKDQEVLLLREFPDLEQLYLAKHLAYRIMRCCSSVSARTFAINTTIDVLLRIKTLVFSVQAARSSSMSSFQSAEETF